MKDTFTISDCLRSLISSVFHLRCTDRKCKHHSLFGDMIAKDIIREFIISNTICDRQKIGATESEYETESSPSQSHGLHFINTNKES